MANIQFDDSRGFCYAGSINNEVTKSRNREIQISNGFDFLPWERHVLEIYESEDDNTGTIEEEKSNKKKKLSKQEKREQRQQKKINASINKKLKRQEEILSSGNDSSGHEDNPFAIQQEIKRLHSKIIKHKERSAKADFKIFQYQSIALYKSDLDHILPEEWINDNNISLVYELISQLFLVKTENKFSYQIQMLYPSLVQLFLHIPIGEDFENILPIKDLQKLKFIFIPINYIDDYQQVDLEQANNGDHWVLCVLNLINNKLYVYDSMHEIGDNDNDLLKELIKRLKLCKSITKGNGSIEILQMKCDQQDNFNDCGVYLLMITCCLISRLLYDQSVSLDISNVKFNALLGRLYMLELIHKLFKLMETA